MKTLLTLLLLIPSLSFAEIKNLVCECVRGEFQNYDDNFSKSASQCNEQTKAGEKFSIEIEYKEDKPTNIKTSLYNIENSWDAGSDSQDLFFHSLSLMENYINSFNLNLFEININRVSLNTEVTWRGSKAIKEKPSDLNLSNYKRDFFSDKHTWFKSYASCKISNKIL